MSATWLKRLVMLEAGAFVGLIMMVLLNEFMDLPHQLLGAPEIGPSLRFEEAAAESVVIFLVGAFVVTTTTWAARRMAHFESFVTLCGWCRRVRVGDRWEPIEGFLASHGATPSHGLCPDCEASHFGEPPVAASH